MGQVTEIDRNTLNKTDRQAKRCQRATDRHTDDSVIDKLTDRQKDDRYTYR